MDWIGWIREPVGAALQWFEAHPGSASWLEAVGSIAAIVFVGLFALFQGRRTTSHESTDRIRRAQGLALVLIPALTAFKPKIETAIIQESKPAPPDEIVNLLDQLYILGVAGGLVLQMVAMLQLINGPNDPMPRTKALNQCTIQLRGSGWATRFAIAMMRYTP